MEKFCNYKVLLMNRFFRIFSTRVSWINIFQNFQVFQFLQKKQKKLLKQMIKLSGVFKQVAKQHFAFWNFQTVTTVIISTENYVHEFNALPRR